MKRMPIPVIDVTAALRSNQDKVLQALKKVNMIYALSGAVVMVIFQSSSSFKKSINSLYQGH